MSSSCNLGFPDCERDDYELEPFGDISGLGVIIGFVATGYLVFALLVCYYFVVCDPKEGTAEGQKFQAGRLPDAEALLHPRRLNHVDVLTTESVNWLLGKIFRSWRPFSSLETDWEEVLSLSILGMCDAQILTGLAIIISGFLSLKCSTSHLSAYHWQMIVNLAWFACVTQLSGLTVIRFYLQNRPVQRNVRFVLMTLLFIFVLAALVPTGYFDWNSNRELSAAQPGDPAICYFPSNNRRSMFSHDFCMAYGLEYLDCAVAGSSAAQSMVFSSCLLAYGYLTRSIKLFKPFSRAVHGFVRDPVSQLFRSTLFKVAKWGDSSTSSTELGNGLFTRLLIMPIFSYFLALRMVLDLVTSMLAEAYWLGVVLIWGTFRLLGARNFSGMPQAVIDDENQWTFGQLLPVLLLISPIFNTFGLFLAKTTHLPPRIMMEAIEMGSQNISSRSLEPPKDLTRPLARSQISRLATMDVSPQSWTDRNYYTAKWMPSCVGTVCLACFYTPGIAAGYLFSMTGDLRPQFTPFRFWVIDMGGLWFVILGVPINAMFGIMCGLGLEWWYKSPKKRLGKQWCHFFFSTSGMATYTFAALMFYRSFEGSWLESDWQKPGNNTVSIGYGVRGKYIIPFPSHITSTFALTAILYAAYSIWQVAMYVWDWPRMETRAG